MFTYKFKLSLGNNNLCNDKDTLVLKTALMDNTKQFREKYDRRKYIAGRLTHHEDSA